MAHLWQDIKRIRHIVGVLTSLGFHQLVEDIELKAMAPFKKGKPVNHRSHPESVRLFFEQAGGAFAKLGQLLALRPDLVGTEYSKEFEKLLEHNPQVKFEHLEPILDQYDHNIKSLNSRPIATGSVAQVHKAKINKKVVAVKIKKPDVDKLFEADIEIMQYVAEKIKQRYNPEIVDPVEIVNEFKRYTRNELDFNHEAKNLQRFKANFKSSKDIVVPQVIFNQKDLLAMEFIDGKNVLEFKDAKTKDKKAIIKKVTNAAYTQLFIHGFFHADLHPGNIFVLPNKKICLLDCGIVGYVDDGLKLKLTNLFIALIEGKLEKTAQALISLNAGNYEPNEELLKEGLYHALGDYYNVPLYKMPVGQMIYECIEVARKSKLKLPKQIVLFAKSIVSLEGLCRELNPSFNVVRSAKPYVTKMLKKKFSARELAKQSINSAQTAQQILINMPKMARSFSKKITILDERLTGIDNTFQYLSRMIWMVSKLIIFALMFSAIIISSALLMNNKPQFYNVSVYSLGGGIAAFILLIIIIKSMRKKP